MSKRTVLQGNSLETPTSKYSAPHLLKKLQSFCTFLELGRLENTNSGMHTFKHSPKKIGMLCQNQRKGNTLWETAFKSCYYSYKSMQKRFPVKGKLKEISKSIRNAANMQNQTSSIKQSHTHLSGHHIKAATKVVYDKINDSFEDEFGLSFANALHRTPDIFACSFPAYIRVWIRSVLMIKQ